MKKARCGFCSLATAGFLWLTLAAPLQAEVIRIPVGSQNAGSTVERPVTGMLKPAVISQYGEPKARHTPVGNPPIERWDYDTFSVYFEYDHVVHSVMKGPKPPQ